MVGRQGAGLGQCKSLWEKVEPEQHQGSYMVNLSVYLRNGIYKKKRKNCQCPEKGFVLGRGEEVLRAGLHVARGR